MKGKGEGRGRKGEGKGARGGRSPLLQISGSAPDQRQERTLTAGVLFCLGSTICKGSVLFFCSYEK